MGCLIALVALLSPRLAFALLWLASDRVSIAYESDVVPIAGLIFLPWTALVYAVVYAPVRGVSALGWLFVAVAFLADLASYGSGARGRRQRA